VRNEGLKGERIKRFFGDESEFEVIFMILEGQTKQERRKWLKKLAQIDRQEEKIMRRGERTLF